MSALLAGFVLGLGGAAHCAAMCGPLVLALQTRDESGRGVPAALGLYHAGRVLVYVLIAAPIGLVGHTLALAGIGRAVAVVSGVVLLAIAAGAPAPPGIRRVERGWSSALSGLWRVAGRIRQTHPVAGAAVSGAINGCLPCGFVYAAAIAAVGIGSLPGAMLFMLGFGAGTTPVLLAVPLIAGWMPPRVRARLALATPLALVLVASLLLMRGLTAPPPPSDHAPAVHHHGS